MTKSGELTDIWDIHAHILPGIDDGAKDWDITIEMIRRSWEAGVRHIIATPHNLPWQHNEPGQTIVALCKEAMERSRKELGITMQILPGQEIYYHVDALSDLMEGRTLSLAGGRYVLVEFAEDMPFSELMTAVGKFRRSPFRPIVAHFERYAALRKQEQLEAFLETGVIVQSNIREMQRGMFDSGRRWLQRRYAEGTVGHVASDMHNLSSRPPIRDQVLLLESLLKEKKDELKRLEAVDAEKNRLFATAVGMGLTVDDAIEILQGHRSVGKTN